ncbi:hypothetical protein MCGFDL_MCGFDL_13915, partial [Dysosmobacter welbionis]
QAGGDAPGPGGQQGGAVPGLHPRRGPALPGDPEGHQQELRADPPVEHRGGGHRRLRRPGTGRHRPGGGDARHGGQMRPVQGLRRRGRH